MGILVIKFLEWSDHTHRKRQESDDQQTVLLICTQTRHEISQRQNIPKVPLQQQHVCEGLLALRYY
jgi:hypothetical protein